MPELATPVGYRIQPQVFQPINPASYFNRELPAAPVVAADSTAKAGAFGAMMKVLGELPGHIIKEYDAGKKRAIGSQVQKQYQDALAGKNIGNQNAPQLSDFRATSEGGLTFNPENPLLISAKLDALKRSSTKPKSLYDSISEQISKNPVAVPEPALPVTDPLGDGDHSDADAVTDLKLGLDVPLPEGAADESGEPPLPDSASVDPASLELAPQLDGFTPTPRSAAATAPAMAVLQNEAATPIALESFSPVPEDRRMAIEGAAQNIGQQILEGFDPANATAQTGPGAAPAAITPVNEEVAKSTAQARRAWDAVNKAVAEGRDDDAELLEITARQKDRELEMVKTARPAIPVKAAAPAVEEAAAAPMKPGVSKDPATGVIKLNTPDGRRFELLPGSNSWSPVVDKTTQASALLKREAAQMGVNTDGKTNGQIAKLMEDAEKTNGVIRPSRLPVAQSLARLVVGHPALKHYPTIKEAKEAVDAGLANPDTGGFSDMALVEGFQRMVNPGATVRSQTINSMIDAAGWLQKFDPSYQWGKAMQGDKFSPAARQRIKKLADDIFDRATHNATPQLNALKRIAKSYGINNPDDFVGNVMVMSPVLAPSGEVVPTPFGGAEPSSPATPRADAPAAQTVRMQKNGRVANIPAANAPKAREQGWTDAP